jgi:uncharacterized Zn finger protein (UPF0148 family)
MKTHTCPNCGHVSQVETQQARAGKALWANLTPAERSAEMSRRRLKGMVQKAYDAIPKRQELVRMIENRQRDQSATAARTKPLDPREIKALEEFMGQQKP